MQWHVDEFLDFDFTIAPIQYKKVKLGLSLCSSPLGLFFLILMFGFFNISPVCVALYPIKESGSLSDCPPLINHRVIKAAAIPSYLSFHGLRNYSTSVSPSAGRKTYGNPDTQKLQIIKENKGKSGVYRWVNLRDRKSYIGSSTNLGRRMSGYFSLLNLKAEIKRSRSIIYRSLIKYGYSNFSLEILEYCEPSTAVSKEQHYLDLLKPAYNILKVAASSLGLKHSLETKAKISKRLRGRTLTAEHVAKIWTLERKVKRLEWLQILNARKTQLQVVVVLDTLTNETTVYNSISEARRSIGCTETAIRVALKGIKEVGAASEQRLLKKRYLVSSERLANSESLDRVLWKSNAHRVEVLDNLTGNTAVYLSIREAAAAIGVVESTVRNALKRFKEKGINKPIKKRFMVKQVTID